MAFMQARDALREREKNGHCWPKLETIYLWNHLNYKGFRDKCARKLGRKLLLDPLLIDEWINEATQEGTNG